MVRCCQEKLLCSTMSSSPDDRRQGRGLTWWYDAARRSYYILQVSSLLRNLPSGRRQGRGLTRWCAAARMSSGGSQSGHSLTKHSPAICPGSVNKNTFYDHFDRVQMQSIFEEMARSEFSSNKINDSRGACGPKHFFGTM